MDIKITYLLFWLGFPPSTLSFRGRWTWLSISLLWVWVWIVFQICWVGPAWLWGRPLLKPLLKKFRPKIVVTATSLRLHVRWKEVLKPLVLRRCRPMTLVQHLYFLGKSNKLSVKLKKKIMHNAHLLQMCWTPKKCQYPQSIPLIVNPARNWGDQG